MSIIYEALKKVENATADAKDNLGSPKRKNSRFLWLVYSACALLIISLAGIFINSLFVKPTSSLPHQPPANITPLVAPQQLKSSEIPITKLPLFFLTGIIFADNEYLALINNQIVKVGDFIEGSRVVKINPDSVEMEFKGSSYLLRQP